MWVRAVRKEREEKQEWLLRFWFNNWVTNMTARQRRPGVGGGQVFFGGGIHSHSVLGMWNLRSLCVGPTRPP